MATISFTREIKLDKETTDKFFKESNRTDKVIEIENIDITKELEEGKQRLKQMFANNIEEITQLAEMNTHTNENGEVYIAKDDEWRNETGWDDIYEWDMIAEIFENARKRNGFTKEDVEKISEKIIDEVRNNKECKPIITITKENEHVLKPEMNEERKKKIALMKKRAAIITKNMEEEN